MPNTITQTLEEHYGDQIQAELSTDEVFSFVDHNGVTQKVTELGIYDPNFQRHIGFTTYMSVIKWWCKQTRTEDLINALKMRDYFPYTTFTDILTESYEDIKSEYEGELVVRPLCVYLESNRALRSAQTPFRLFIKNTDSPQEVEAEKAVYVAYNTSFRNIYFREKVTTTSSDCESTRVSTIWNKHHNYSFQMNKDDFNWFRSVSKESGTFFGMELEMSTSLSTVEIQAIVTEMEPKQEPFFIFKQDSSISGRFHNSLELVTVPCTPKYLRTHWKIFFKKLEKLTRAQNKTIGDFFDVSESLSNGIHIHVDKGSFTDKFHTSKFLTAWHQWDDDSTGIISDVACRPQKYYENNYCVISSKYKNTSASTARTPSSIPKFVRQRAQRSLARRLKGIKVDERQSVAHDSSSNTIEVRVYQGIVDIKHIMRCISFTEAMFEYTESIGLSGFDSNFAPTFTKFIKNDRKYKALHGIFKFNKEAV